MRMPAARGYILALDVGQKRIGVAISDGVVPFARSLPTLEVSSTTKDEVNKLLNGYNVTTLVVGYPRQMDGSAGKQAGLVEEFISSLNLSDNIQIVWQDESLTSVKAEEELSKTKPDFKKSEVDALAAIYILEDYLKELK